MTIVKKVVKKILFAKNLPKTIYVNFRVFPFSTAKHLPIYCGSRVSLHGLSKGSVIVDSPIRRGMIHIGLDAVRGSMLGVRKHKQSFFQVSKGAKIVFKGKAHFASGNTVVLGQNAEFVLGDDFSTNVLCNFFVYNKRRNRRTNKLAERDSYWKSLLALQRRNNYERYFGRRQLCNCL